MAETTRGTVREVAARLVGHGIAAAEAFSRPDLAAQLRDLGDWAANAWVRVLVAGEYKQGKSSLVNALVGADVCPTGADAATVVPLSVRWSQEPTAVADVESEGGSERIAIGVDTLADWVVEGAGERMVRHVDVGLPSDVLLDGLTFVDMPGAGGLGSFTGALTVAAVGSAEAVLFVSDAGQELTAGELQIVRRLADDSAVVALVKSRTDIHPDWRRVVQADSGHAGPFVHATFGISSTLAAKARESGDHELVAESAIGVLAGWLRTTVLADAARRRTIAVADAVERIAAALESPLRAERAGLADPQRTGSITGELERARQQADRLRSAAGRWQQVLGDAFADLSGDVDHGLRAAARGVLTQAEDAIDAIDPATSWAQYEPQLRRQVAALVGDHYAELRQRIAAAAGRVATVFTDDVDSVERLIAAAGVELPSSPSAAATDRAVALADVRRRSIAGQSLVLLRSSYGGALMAGFLGGAIGLVVATPAALAVGLTFGAKGLREENQRQLLQRRSHAKATVRKFVDDVLFEVAKESRDTVRLAQRRLRDHFAEQADEMTRTTSLALEAARGTVERDSSSRGARLRDIDAELERLTWLAERCHEVRTALGGPQR
jgi:hypothetical protein